MPLEETSEPHLVMTEAMRCLRLTKDYCDLVLVVEGYEIKTHKAILCSVSKVFKAMCDGTFEEGANSKINIEAPTASVEAVKRMLDYIYLNTYDDGDEETTEPDESGEALDHTANEVIESRSTVLPLVVRKLLNNVRVYALADYYEIPFLKKKAFEKCSSRLRIISDDEYKCMGPALIEVYESTSDKDDLRKLVIERLSARTPFLISTCTDFVQSLSNIPELMTDWFSIYAKTSEKEKADMKLGVRKAENEYQSNLQRIEEAMENATLEISRLSRIVDIVNRTNMCYNCKRDLNVIVREGTKRPQCKGCLAYAGK